MRCQEFRQMIDSYLNDELLVETNHEVLRHLESCTACRSELAAHRALQTRLRAAVKSAPEMRINPVFARRLEANLRQTALRPTVWMNLKSRVFSGSPILAVTAAACLLFGALFGANWLRHSSPATDNNIAGQSQTNQPLENSRPPEESSQPEAVQAAWRELTGEAFGDHENCALHFRLKENPITLDEAAEKYGKFNKDLDRTVITSAREIFSEKNSGEKSGEIEFLEAHSCVFEGRRFAHVVARRGDRTISILVTDTDLPDANDNQITNQSAGTMQAASFRANHHVVFIVSDLTERENTIVAQTLAPAVRRHIERSEAGA
jgi:hypothetical protein